MTKRQTRLINGFLWLRVVGALAHTNLVDYAFALFNQRDILTTIIENFLSFNFESIEHLKLRHGLNDETYILFNTQTNLQTFEIRHESLHLDNTILNL